MRMPSLSIRSKLLVAFCLIATVPVIVLGLMVTDRTETILQQRVSRELRVESGAAADTLSTFFEGARRDLLSMARFLQRHPSFDMDSDRRREIEDEFFHFVYAESTYCGIRLIGADGWEKLRIDNVDGQLKRVVPEDYRYMGERSYVREALKRPPGEVYLSPLDFSQERRGGEVSRRLGVRLATAVPGRDGSIAGLVVIDIFGNELLKRIEPVQPVSGSRLYLLGEDGQFVVRSWSGAEVSVQTGQAEEAGEAEALGGEILAAEVLRGDPSRVAMGRASLVATAPVDLGSRRWLLVKTFPRSLLDQDLHRIRQSVLILALVLLVPAAWLAVAAARSFSRPISKLSRFADAIAGGDYSQEVRHPPGDEFGQLAEALNRMAGSLASSRQRLLQWNRALLGEVDRRTEELRNSEEKYRLIVSAESDAILIIDSGSRRVEEANNAACSLYGYAREELIGLDPVVLSAEPEKSLHRAGEILGGHRNRIDLALHRRKDGAVFPVSISAGVFQWQGRTMLVGIVRDISEHQRVERLKDEMLAGIGHEMRTPLTAVIGFLELLLGSDLEPDQRMEYLAICLQESERLQSLIENLLALQRLRSGEALKRSPLNVCEFLEQEAAAFAAEHGEGRVRVDCAGGLPEIQVDPEMLQQALANLLENAARYSPPGGMIVLGASREADAVALRVEDRGPGIPSALQEQLFDRFFRIDSRDGHRIGGTGLGLPLVKEIARAHGGRVRVESREGEGSTFVLLLPQPQAEKAQAAG